MEDKLNKISDYFKLKGFNIIIDNDDELLYFIKKESDTKKVIQIWFRNVDGVLKLGRSASAYIDVEKVEEILFIITEIITPLKNTISASIGINKENSLSDDFFYIKNERDVDDYIRKLDVYYQSHIAPFFEAVPTLQSFNDKVLNVVPFDDYHHYLSGEFGLKAMIIMHLCNNPLYLDYVNYREEEFKNSPYLHNITSRYHKISKQSFDEFNKFKEMIAKGEI